MLFAVLVFANANSVSDIFEAKPNGQKQKVSLQLPRGSAAPVTCDFSFSAFGGTNERWSISITQDGPVYVCNIARPEQASYLYFQDFSASFDAAAAGHLEVDAKNNNGRLLAVEVESSGHTVKSSGNFKNALASLVLTSKRPAKGDL